MLSTALVVLVCVASLFVAHGRYLLGLAGEGAAVLLDRLHDAWKFSGKKDEEPEASAETLTLRRTIVEEISLQEAEEDKPAKAKGTAGGGD